MQNYLIQSKYWDEGISNFRFRLHPREWDNLLIGNQWLLLWDRSLEFTHIISHPTPLYTVDRENSERYNMLYKFYIFPYDIQSLEEI